MLIEMLIKTIRGIDSRPDKVYVTEEEVPQLALEIYQKQQLNKESLERIEQEIKAGRVMIMGVPIGVIALHE